jgi:sporulation protein YlmC with PRC-barrel domain
MEDDMRVMPVMSLFVSFVLTTAPALAQPDAPAPSMPRPSAGDSAFGAQEPVRVGTINFMTEVQPGQWRASKLRGLNVYNPNNEKIGDISEMLVDQSGKVQGVVVGVGGFLGIGSRGVVFPFDQMKFVVEPRPDATGSTTGEARLAMTSPGGGTVPSPTGAGTAAAPSANPNMATNNAGAGSPPAPSSPGALAPGQQAAGAGSQSAPDHAVLTVTLTKDQLREMPEFK